MWLAKLDRGLREEEGSDLREWVKAAANRTALVQAARLWHDPDVMAVLSQLFPISPELANPKPRPSVFKVALTCAAAVCIVVFAAVVLNGQKPWSYFDGSLVAPPRLPVTPAQRRDTLTYGEATVGALEAALVEPGFQTVDKIDASELETRLAWQRGVLTVLPAH